MNPFATVLVLMTLCSVSFAEPIICLDPKADPKTHVGDQVGFGYFGIFKKVVLLHSAPGRNLAVYPNHITVTPALPTAPNPEQVNYEAVTSVVADNGTVRAELIIKSVQAGTPKRDAVYTETTIASGVTTMANLVCVTPAN